VAVYNVVAVGAEASASDPLKISEPDRLLTTRGRSEIGASATFKSSRANDRFEIQDWPSNLPMTSR